MFLQQKLSLVSLIALLIGTLSASGDKTQGADPVIRFPEDIAWKAIFDIGFRPKHVSGLELDSCRIVDQPFQLQFKGKPELFTLDRGLLTFQFKADNEIRMIWHQSTVPVSMEEARQLNALLDKLRAEPLPEDENVFPALEHVNQPEKI